jgi:hypothetical protein
MMIMFNNVCNYKENNVPTHKCCLEIIKKKKKKRVWVSQMLFLLIEMLK